MAKIINGDVARQGDFHFPLQNCGVGSHSYLTKPSQAVQERGFNFTRTNVRSLYALLSLCMQQIFWGSIIWFKGLCLLLLFLLYYGLYFIVCFAADVWIVSRGWSLSSCVDQFNTVKISYRSL
ncbi:uncharacterized protein BYT42DRAFT_48260 [Radiomyces spectabilis]|uniref:uncharacterized protein n=1 Tax=Radiomyces spectabilis TaxID=64574 RepID=UPI0022208C05|nr:uncharacterized protein BYT42DRAFT_48260 [Radiomyces spectabilis]KAI8372841.1 hypothetical protein BYT42DRAFT_48260 [Radiomyces spectabilis]